jgi:sirohydrochlorin cobaltochelatase
LKHQSGYLLVAHGSRDPRSQLALTQLAELFSNCLTDQQVGTAVLEFGEASLDQQILTFAGKLQAGDCLEILPLFLLPGVHVREDLPTAHGGMAELLAQPMHQQPMDAWILLAHGSRRPSGNLAIADLGDRIGAHPAYWSVAPGLDEVLAGLISRGHQQIGILPYFLFAGKTTDAINQNVQALAEQFPQVSLHLTHSLQPTIELATILLDLTQLP